MIKQKSFNYQFNNNLNEFNFFVNETNFYAFDILINNKNQLSFLYGPNKSGKSFLSNFFNQIFDRKDLPDLFGPDRKDN